jgi:DNA repair photolyase
MGLLGSIGCGMWSLTPYDKCDFRCVYCCTQVQGTSKPSHSRDQFLDVLGPGLDQIPEKELIIIGAYCDPYPPPEEHAGLTRLAIEELNRRGREYCVVTKGTTILRDIDLFPRSRETVTRPGGEVRHRCTLTVSICSVSDDVLRRLDPGAPSATERFAVLRRLYDAGIYVELNALPWIPGVSETEEIIRRVPRGVRIVFAPLRFLNDHSGMSLLGRRYTRDDVWASYLEEYQRFGHVPNTSWVRPSPPPTENDPMYRLPVLDPPARRPLRRLLEVAGLCRHMAMPLVPRLRR